MYKMIIADDEKMIQNGLEKMVDWHALGFDVVKIFSDGAEVIEFLENEPVDVVLTDIKMSTINGIEVAKYVYEKKIPCKVLFMSGYQEFELAYQAIKYGVDNYILKPCKIEEVQAVFKKIYTELEARSQDIDFKRKMEKRWNELYPVLTERFVNGLIMGAIDDKKEIKRRMNLLYPEINELYCPCILATVEIIDYDNYIKNIWSYSSEQFDEAVVNFVNIFKESGFFHVIYKYKEKLRLFIIVKQFYDNDLLCMHVMDRFVDQISDVFKVKIKLEIDKIFTNIYQIADMREEIVKMNVHPCDEEMYRQEQIKLIMTNIMMNNINAAQKLMENLLQEYSGADEHYRTNLVIEIFSRISNLLWENNPEFHRVIAPYIDYRSILNMESREVAQYCNYLFDKLRGMSGKIDQTSLIKRVKEYIDEHILEDILLEDVAEYVYISRTHLSRIFSEQTGETFQQCLSRKKMEKAAELLRDPKYKIYQVGEMLGYKTARYFSKLFYNFWGYYPNQYRNDILKVGEGLDEDA